MPEEFIITSAEEEILRTISLKVSGGGSLENIFDMIFQEIRQIIPCNRLGIGLVEENGQRVVTRYVKADYEPLHITAGYAADVHGSLYQPVLESNTPVINIFNEHGKGTYDTEIANLLAAEGIRACILAPVIPNANITGILSCCSKDSSSYSKHHSSLLQEIAKSLRFALERTYQLNQIEKHYQAYKEMLSFVAHELKSPISSIISLGRTMAEGYYGKMEENQRKIMKRIIKKAEYLDAVSNQYLNLSRIESNIIELRPELVDFIDDVIEPAIELVMPQIEERRMNLERSYHETVFPVRCDPDMIRIVILNLITNGIKYGNKNGTIKISLAKTYKKFSISVWNEGPGFSEQEKHLLFKKFSRLGAKELIEQKGSGIGLYMSWKIVQLHGGRIFAESKQGAWAKFTVELAQHMDFCIVD